ncbi:conserved hypothetical protein, partial [Ricinus communis]
MSSLVRRTRTSDLLLPVSPAPAMGRFQDAPVIVAPLEQAIWPPRARLSASCCQRLAPCPRVEPLLVLAWSDRLRGRLERVDCWLPRLPEYHGGKPVVGSAQPSDNASVPHLLVKHFRPQVAYLDDHVGGQIRPASSGADGVCVGRLIQTIGLLLVRAEKRKEPLDALLVVDSLNSCSTFTRDL